MKLKEVVLALLLSAVGFAVLEIPEDQPICRLYGIIRLFGTVAGVLAASYGGFILATCHETTEKSMAKNLITGVIIGLIIIWIAPIVVAALVESDGICGW